MFNFFKKKPKPSPAEEARAQALKQVLTQFQNGTGNPLEATLVLHLIEKNDDSLAQFLNTFGGSEVWTLVKSGTGNVGDPAVTEGPDGRPYVVIFTSRERAKDAAAQWELDNVPTPVPTLELVFAIGSSVGVVLNATAPHLQWTFTPEHVSNLRSVFEGSHKYEVGGIYLFKDQGAWRATKILHVDEGGIHIRLYANAWPEHPQTVTPETLTLQSSPSAPGQAIGHMPVVRASFLAMGPKQVTKAPVTDDELDGYRMWAEAKGGYFAT